MQLCKDSHLINVPTSLIVSSNFKSLWTLAVGWTHWGQNYLWHCGKSSSFIEWVTNSVPFYNLRTKNDSRPWPYYCTRYLLTCVDLCWYSGGCKEDPRSCIRQCLHNHPDVIDSEQGQIDLHDADDDHNHDDDDDDDNDDDELAGADEGESEFFIIMRLRDRVMMFMIITKWWLLSWWW